MYLHITKAQAERIAESLCDPWHMVAILTEIALPEWLAWYLAQPIPRPVIQLVLPPDCSEIGFSVSFLPRRPVPMIDAKIDFGLTSTATHQIPGRGTVKTCAPHELPHLGPITIDGEPMILTGIEGRAGWKPGDEIGLIVRPVDKATLKQAADIAIKTSAEILASDIKTDVHGHVVEVPK